ncbi:glycosyltransferase family 4 protein [Flammeovirgaceae bacterium SG7u.111]|nr:glycosyltransferase family 4 protein [Flammeovirgaceae bacterium SG7u.132]WPO36884.1 glycosyltransferase family 4 protein [Flammeovirgaceae bacterium SG7u.111]
MPKQLCILSIVPFPLYPVQSGGQKKTAGLLEHFVQQHKVTLVTSADSGTPVSPFIDFKPWLRPDKWRYFDWRVLAKLRGLAQSADVVILDQPFWGLLGLLLAKQSGKKLIIHSHNIEGQRFKTIGKWWWWILAELEKYVMRKADGVLFITEEDRAFAIPHMGLKPEKCSIAEYGIELREPPLEVINTRTNTRKELFQNLDLEEGTSVFLFYGLMSYQPNIEALECILTKILPLLVEDKELPFHVIICGKGLPERYKELLGKSHISYLGFVDDIDAMIMAADVVLNPVLSGGGVKTKLIDALAVGTLVVSTETGALGVNTTACKNMLMLAPDNDWNKFVEQLKVAIKTAHATPASFYEHYYLGNIANRVVKWILHKF